MSDSVLIVGNGGVKTTRTHEEDNTLNGYVISLQKLDALLKADIKKGLVRIEKTEIIGVDDKEYDLWDKMYLEQSIFARRWQLPRRR